jgi:hypothetical protein
VEKKIKIRLLVAVVSAAVTVAITAAVLSTRPGPLGVNGPKEPSVVARGEPTSPAEYARGGNSRLAVLLTRTDDSWLDLAHGLKSFGVPFVLTSDWKAAAAHRVILVYPDLSDRSLPPEALEGLDAAVRAGATLIAVNPTAKAWRGEFGFQDSLPGRGRAQWRFRPEVAPLLALKDPKETTVPLTWLGEGRDLDTCGFTGSTETVLADFGDGTAALLRRRIGRGAAYALGLDIGQMLHVSHTLRDETIERSYVNSFEPAADVFPRLLAALYREGEPAAATLGTVPMGRALSVVVTHDIDFLDSVRNALQFADYESSAGIRATYFLQTKYVTDASEKAFLTPENLQDFKRLAATGHEMASHSVAHSRQFAKFKMGSGRERYPSYKPRVVSEEATSGGTILGELRVSRFLLESLLGGRPIESFRPGHLSDPYTLPEALRAVGYLWSSACTANNSLTHLPYRLTESRESRVEEPLFEFPVTVEDEESPLDERLPQSLALAEQIASYGGLYVILIHPNVVAGKLDFEKGFVAAWKDRAWFGALSDLGRWWSARDAVEVDADAAAKTVTVTAPKPIDGLLLNPPADWKLVSVEPATSAAEAVPGGLLLRRVSGPVVLRFR